jgi:hypothetical protein
LCHILLQAMLTNDIKEQRSGTLSSPVGIGQIPAEWSQSGPLF